MINIESHKIVEAVKRQLEDVMDPELPFLTIGEMGMLRDVYYEGDHTVIVLTPTYSGCPATDIISEDSLKAARVVDPKAEIAISMSPAWTTDWISDETRAKMEANGIAPPLGSSNDRAFLVLHGLEILFIEDSLISNIIDFDEVIVMTQINQYKVH